MFCAGGCDLRRFARKREEPLYAWSGIIAEWWNTWSNALFVILGVIRLLEPMPDEFVVLYALYALAGVCSAVHHALDKPKITIWLDWTPIASSILYLVWLFATGRFCGSMLAGVQLATWALLALAFFLLATDHICTPLPVPLGHSLWHVVAAVAIDRFYQDCIHHLATCQF